MNVKRRTGTLPAGPASPRAESTAFCSQITSKNEKYTTIEREFKNHSENFLVLTKLTLRRQLLTFSPLPLMFTDGVIE